MVIDKEYNFAVLADEYKKRADRRLELLGRANMALLCYTQSHGTPHTQLMDEMAEELGLDANGNTLVANQREEELGDDAD